MLDQTPNLRHLRAFNEVATAHSIKAASRRIFLSQPAITQAIGKLESSLGTLLFHRRHDGTYLTDPGGIYRQRVERCMAFLRAGTHDAIRIGERVVEGRRVSTHPHTLISNAHLRTLLSLQNASSYTMAARQAGISQPVLYRNARDLEAVLNLRIFEKTSYGIHLTRAGSRLARAARLGLRELEQGRAELQELQGIASGVIRVGSMPLARTRILPSTIHRFAHLKPEVSIKVVDGPYNDLLERLRHGDLDILIGALRDPLPYTDMYQEQLFSTSISVVARSDHPLSAHPGLTLDDLKGYAWVVPRIDTPARALFDEVFTDHDPNVLQGVVECSSQIVVRELLTCSDRLTFISSHQIEHEQREGILTVLNTDLPPSQRPIGITLRRDWQPTTTERLFLSILRSLSQGLRTD